MKSNSCVKPSTQVILPTEREGERGTERDRERQRERVTERDRQRGSFLLMIT